MATRALAALVHLLRQSRIHHGGATSDADLLELFISQRDEDAFETLVRLHGPMVLGVCRRILHNEADVEDCFQATFLVLVRKAASIRPRGVVGNWLYGTARKAALKARAMRNLRHRREKEAATEKAGKSFGRDRDLQELLDQELETMPDKYRAAIVLCDLEGLTTAAAAQQVGCSHGSLRVRLVRGRAMLGKRLARHGLAVSGTVLATALCQNAASACVPGSLVVSTVQAATLLAAGKALAAGAISAKVVALMEGVLKAMLMTKIKVALAVVMTLNLIGAGVGLVYCQTAGSGQDKQGKPALAQEKPNVPTTAGQQPEPRKEAKEEATAGQPIDYQKMAQGARWKPPEQDDNRWTMSVMADGKKVYDWPVPMPSTFFVDSNCVVYHAVFPRWAAGCEVVAYDLRGGKPLWRTRLKGVGEGEERPHSEYSNVVRLERVNDEVLAVYGEENGGSPIRYLEIVDMKTGKTVGHKEFPRQQPEPKKEAKEEEARKIDYQKMAQEARWKQPKDDAKQWTISISADGKKVYDWPVATPSGLFVNSNCVVYRPTFSPIRTGCDVIAYDLKGQKLLWRTHLEGLGPVPHSEYWNVVRLERVNDEVLAVYGDEAAGRYVEIVDMKTGKTVGHKVFPKKADGKEDEKKEGGTDAKAEAAAGKTEVPNIPPTISSKELVAEYLKDKKAAEKKYGGPDNPKELIVEGIVVWIGYAQAGIFVAARGDGRGEGR